MNAVALPRQMAFARLGYAVAAFATPRVATAALGARPKEMTPAGMGWARVFASREAALAALSLGSEAADPADRRKALLLNAAVDAVDVVAILALVRRQGSKLPLLVALPAGLVSIASHVLAARALPG